MQKVKLLNLQQEFSFDSKNLKVFHSKLREFEELYNKHNNESFEKTFAIKASIATNAIENVFVNEKDLIQKVESGLNIKDYIDYIDFKSKDLLTAALFADSYLKEFDSNEFINWVKETHGYVFKFQITKKPGVFKAKNNWIKSTDTNELIKEFIDHQDVEENLAKLASFLWTSKLEPIVLAALIHGQFISIHPFVDGNGRTGRLLSDKIIENGYNLPLWIDEAISVNYIKYIQALDEYSFNSNPTPLIDFFIEMGIQQLNRNIWIIQNNLDNWK